MSLYLEWSKRVAGLSTDSSGIAGSMPMLSALTTGLLLDKDKVPVTAAFNTLMQKLQDGSYTAANWSKSEEWNRIETAVNAGRVYRQGRDEELSALGNQVNAAGSFAESLSKRLTTTEVDLRGLKEASQKTGQLTESLNVAVTQLKANSVPTTDFNQLTARLSVSESGLAALTTMVKNEQSTWTDTGLPSPQSGESESSIKAREMPWGKDVDPSIHIGDTYIVTGSGVDRGRMYRFVRNSDGQYYWEKVSDNDGTLALSKISAETIARRADLTSLQTALTGELKTLRNDLKQEQTDRDSAIVTAFRTSKEDMAKQMATQITTRVSSLYSVKTFQEGSLVSGRIVSSVQNSNGDAVIRHSAVVRSLVGEDVTSSKSTDMQWKINRGSSLERHVIGSYCEVTVNDLVHEAGVPAYYDIELYRNF